MKITCDEATAICDKSQYKEASFFEILKLRVHLLLCKKCGLYSKQNAVMSKCFEKKRALDLLKTKGLCCEEKEKMDQALKENNNK